MQKAIKKTQKEKTGLSKYGLLKLLRKTKNFVGVFAEDELRNLSLTLFPSFFVVNLDSSYMHGSHWLAIRISNKSIEIFDPLGFEILGWPRIPCNLLKFVKRWAVHRKTFISPILQPKESFLCGFYCILFIICRNFISFSEILNQFGHPNSNDLFVSKLFR